MKKLYKIFVYTPAGFSLLEENRNLFDPRIETIWKEIEAGFEVEERAVMACKFMLEARLQENLILTVILTVR